MSQSVVPAPLVRADLHAGIETRFPDNTTEDITPQDLRDGLHELVDSVFVTASDQAGPVFARTASGFVDYPDLDTALAANTYSLELNRTTFELTQDHTVGDLLLVGHGANGTLATGVTVTLTNQEILRDVSLNAALGTLTSDATLVATLFDNSYLGGLELDGGTVSLFDQSVLSYVTGTGTVYLYDASGVYNADPGITLVDRRPTVPLDAYTKAQTEVRLTTKQPALTGTLSDYAYGTVYTLPPRFLNQRIEIASFREVATLKLPAVTLADAPALLQLYSTIGSVARGKQQWVDNASGAVVVELRPLETALLQLVANGSTVQWVLLTKYSQPVTRLSLGDMDFSLANARLDPKAVYLVDDIGWQGGQQAVYLRALSASLLEQVGYVVTGTTTKAVLVDVAAKTLTPLGSTANGAAGPTAVDLEKVRTTLSLTATRTADFMLALTDTGSVIPVSAANDVVITMPDSNTVALPLNSLVYIRRMGTGKVTLQPAAGVQFLPPGVGLSLNAYGEAVIHKIDLNTFWLKGDLS